MSQDARQALRSRARAATLGLVDAFVLWDYGRGPSAPYVAAYEEYLAAKAVIDDLVPEAGPERWRLVGDALFAVEHAWHVHRAREGRDARAMEAA